MLLIIEKIQRMFCDLSKVFDPVKHKIFLEKLWRLGVREIGNNLIKLYLSGRKQKVIWGNSASNLKEAENGVPQVSILHLVLF